MKTGNKANYEKQLINGKLFCDWLIALFIQHKSLDPNTIVVPLLIWKPRQNSVCKDTTTHHEDSDDINKMELSQFDGAGFEIKHCETVPIVKLISKLEKAEGKPGKSQSAFTEDSDSSPTARLFKSQD